MISKTIRNESFYEFSCPNCGKIYKAEMMPEIKTLKKIGHHINCVKCGKRIPIV